MVLQKFGQPNKGACPYYGSQLLIMLVQYRLPEQMDNPSRKANSIKKRYTNMKSFIPQKWFHEYVYKTLTVEIILHVLQRSRIE